MDPLVTQDPFSRGALDANRARRLTAEQIRGLRIDASESKRWEVLDAGRIRIDGEDQRAEADGDELYLVTRGPTFRFHRVRSF